MEEATVVLGVEQHEVGLVSFKHSENLDQLAIALAKAQGQFTNAKKTKTNTHLTSKFADLAAVLDDIRKPLSDNGIAYLQPISVYKGEVCLITMLIHGESGQNIVSYYPLPRHEARGLNEFQSVGLTISYLRRYALQSMVGGASEDTDAQISNNGKTSNHRTNPDPRGADNRSKGQGQAPKPTPAPPSAPAPSATGPSAPSPEQTNEPPTDLGLPTLGGVTFIQVGGEIHATGKGTFDHKENLKALGFGFRDKAWRKAA